MARRKRARMLLARSSTCGSWHENACLSVVHVPRRCDDVDGYYELLGVSPDATDGEIRAAGKALLMSTHPDHGGDEDGFIEAARAYKALSDPASRAEYDAKVAGITVSVAQPAWTAPVKLGEDGEPAWYKEPADLLSEADVLAVRRWHALLLAAAREFQQPFEIKAGICRCPAGYYQEGDVYLIGHGTVPQRWAAVTTTLKRMVEK